MRLVGQATCAACGLTDGLMAVVFDGKKPSGVRATCCACGADIAHVKITRDQATGVFMEHVLGALGKAGYEVVR